MLHESYETRCCVKRSTLVEDKNHQSSTLFLFEKSVIICDKVNKGERAHFEFLMLFKVSMKYVPYRKLFFFEFGNCRKFK